MSYILNALRKSERERSEKTSETLQNRILETPPHSQKRFSWFSIFLVVINLALLSFFIWAQFQREVPVENVEVASVQNQPILSAQAKPEPVKEITVPAPNASAPALSFAEQMQAESKPKAVPPTQPKTAAAVKKQTLDVVRSPVQTRQSVKELLTAKVDLKLRNETMTKPVQAQVPQDGLPYLEELPFEFRSTVPKLDINVFVYSQNPAESFVMIDMKKYTAGQFVQDHLKLYAIKADSLVLSYHGKKFQLKRP